MIANMTIIIHILMEYFNSKLTILVIVPVIKNDITVAIIVVINVF